MKEKSTARLQKIHLSDVTEEKIKWLWEGRFPASRLSVVGGDGDTNKSYMLLDLALRIVEGRPHPDTGAIPEVRGSVLWITGEDSPGEVKRRAKNLNYQGSDIWVVEGIFRSANPTSLDLVRDVKIIEQETKEIGAAFVCIDPITAFEPGVDSNSDNDVRSLILQPLADLAKNTGAGVIFIKHFNKNPNLPIQYRIGGSVAYVSAPRAAWEVKTINKRKGERLLRKIKMNVWPCADPLVFFIDESGVIHYKDASEGSDIAPTTRGTRGRPTKIPQAKALWEELLEDGPVSLAKIHGLSDAVEISTKTMDRARRELGLRLVSIDGKRLWTLPEEKV